jgi:transposase InsO family protein/dUTPase
MVCEKVLATTRPVPRFRPSPAERERAMPAGHDTNFPCHIRVRFPTRNPEEHLQADAMIDSGNRVPGSAVISEAFLNNMGLRDLLLPTDTRILTASEDGQPLQVIGKIRHLYMAVSHTLILHLHHVTVCRNLSHPLNLGGYFLREFNTRLCFDMSPPCLWIRGEYIPLRGVPGSIEEAEEEMGYDGPLPGPIPEPPRAIENGTHWADDALNARKETNLLAMDVPPAPAAPPPEPPDEFPEISEPPSALLHEDTFVNGQPCPAGPIRGWPPDAEPVKSRPAVYELNAMSDATSPPTELIVAKRVALPARSITMVPVRVEGTPVTNASHILTPEQRFGEHLIIPEGLYDQRPGTTDTYQVLVVNEGEEPLLLDLGRAMVGELVKADLQTGPGPPAPTLHAMDEPPEPPDMEQLWLDLEMQGNPFMAKDPLLKKEVWKLIYEYRDIFSNTTPGCTDVVQLQLRLKPGTQPIRQKFRNLNPKQEAELEAQLETWLKEGVIEPSSSAWSSPLVPIKKKDGSTRWAVDYRALNKCLELDSYPLPKIQQLVERAGGHKVYSALDAVSAYYTIKIESESRACTAFTSPRGLYQWKRMPFGLATAPSVYSRFIAGVLNPLGTAGLQSYLDDVLCFHLDTWAHLARLREVFAAHRQGGIRLKPAKTKLFRPQVDYLGHTLSEEGIAMQDAYIARILDWPAPENPRDLMALLGFFGYYRAFIPEYADLTYEMNQQKTARELAWTPEMSTQLEQLKNKFRDAPIRAPPRFDLPAVFQLTTDYSCRAISAILSQVQGGEERLIAALGRKTTDPETRYPSWKGEMAAIMYGIRKFHSILSYKSFQINTDSSALLQMKSLNNSTGMVARWQEELAALDFTVLHRPGTQNTNADALSRREDSSMPAPTAEEEAEQAEYVHHLHQLGETSLAAVTTPLRLDPERIFEAQTQDSLLLTVRHWVSEGQPPSKPELKGRPRDEHQYAARFAALGLDERGCLTITASTLSGERTRYLLPPSLQREAFFLAHGAPLAGHNGMNATVARMAAYFWWPTLQRDVQLMVQTCPDCVQKITKERLKAGIHVPSRQGYPQQVLFVDLVGPLPETPNGNRYILSCQDGFSRFVCLYPIPDKRTLTVAEALMHRHIATFGCPLKIHSDNGMEFTGRLFTALAAKLEIGITHPPPYNPQSNRVERFHRTLNTGMRLFLERNDSQWEPHLPAISMAYNMKVCAATGVTPFLAYFGREAKLPADIVLRLPDTEYASVPANVQAIIERYQAIFEAVQKKEDGTIRRNANAYDCAAKYQVGDMVWYLAPRKVPGKPGKITKGWTGPWKIVRQATDVHYDITPVSPMPSVTKVTAHVGRLRPYTGDIRANQIPADIQDDEDGDEDAASIPVGQQHPKSEDGPRTMPVHQPAPPLPVPAPPGTGAPSQDPAEEALPQQPWGEQPKLTNSSQLTDAVWNPNTDMEAATAMDQNEPPTTRDEPMTTRDEPMTTRDEPRTTRNEPQTTRHEPETTRHEPTEMETHTEDPSDEMCSLQMKAIPIRVGAKLPSNLDKAGAPMEFYTPESFAVPPLGAARVPLGLHVVLPPSTELVLQTRNNFQRRGLTVTNPTWETGPGLTILVTNASQVEQRVSRGACVARASLHQSSTPGKETPAS